MSREVCGYFKNNLSHPVKQDDREKENVTQTAPGIYSFAKLFEHLNI
jgi:hypothetical protein